MPLCSLCRDISRLLPRCGCQAAAANSVPSLCRLVLRVLQLLEGAQLAADLIASYEQSFDPQQAEGQQAGVDDFSGPVGGCLLRTAAVASRAAGCCLRLCLHISGCPPVACRRVGLPRPLLAPAPTPTRHTCPLAHRTQTGSHTRLAPLPLLQPCCLLWWTPSWRCAPEAARPSTPPPPPGEHPLLLQLPARG